MQVSVEEQMETLEKEIIQVLKAAPFGFSKTCMSAELDSNAGDRGRPQTNRRQGTFKYITIHCNVSFG